MLCDLRRATLPVASLFSILFLDTLCSKKWYDMPHIGCGIHSLQWSTIPRIGRHSAGYSYIYIYKTFIADSMVHRHRSHKIIIILYSTGFSKGC